MANIVLDEGIMQNNQRYKIDGPQRKTFSFLFTFSEYCDQPNHPPSATEETYAIMVLPAQENDFFV